LNKILNSFLQQVHFQTKLELFANSSFIWWLRWYAMVVF
jgi:hypothetical protein